MLKINPFYLLLFFYALINFVFACIGFSINTVEIEFQSFNIKSSSFVFAFFIQFFICFVIFLFYIGFGKGGGREIELNNRYGLILFFLQFLFMLYNLTYGVNVAGVSVTSENKILNFFFILLSVDILFILISPYIKSDRWFYLNLSLFVVSNLLRGWMGSVLLAFFIMLCRKEFVRVSLNSFFKYLFLSVLVLLILPYLTQIKWTIRSNGTFFDAIKSVSEIGYFLLLEDSVYYMFNRFQHNYHVALLLENYIGLNQKYNSGVITPFWMEGIAQTIFSFIFSLDKQFSLGNVMARDIFGSKDTWSSNPGLAGWFIILQEKFIFLVLYSSFLLALGFYIAAKYFNKKMVLILGVFSLFYLFHGWIGMYVTLLTYLLLIFIISRVRF